MKRSIGMILIFIATFGMILVPGPPAPAAHTPTAKIGCAISFTGGKSRSGKLYRDSYDMAVEQINKTGGGNGQRQKI